MFSTPVWNGNARDSYRMCKVVSFDQNDERREHWKTTDPKEAARLKASVQLKLGKNHRVEVEELVEKIVQEVCTLPDAY